MLILGLDTATRDTVVAVGEPDGGRASEVRDAPAPGTRPRHATRLLELIAEAMERAGADWPAVERIAVGVGPGTFTGLRIGIATARALADARAIPLFGVSSLHSLALVAREAAQAAGAGLAAGVIDARRGEMFAAAWRCEEVGEPGARPLVVPAALPPSELATALSAPGVRSFAVGDGAVASRELLERCGAVVPPDPSGLHRVSAIGHCRLAAALPPEAAGTASPAYLRVPDAELTRRSRNP